MYITLQFTTIYNVPSYFVKSLSPITPVSPLERLYQKYLTKRHSSVTRLSMYLPQLNLSVNFLLIRIYLLQYLQFRSKLHQCLNVSLLIPTSDSPSHCPLLSSTPDSPLVPVECVLETRCYPWNIKYDSHQCVISVG